MAETYRIDIVASPRQAVAGVQSVERSLEQLNRTAASTNSLLRGALQVAGFGTGIALIQRLGAELTDLTDTYTQIQNRLGAVTSGTEELNQVTGSLLDIANRSRTGFEATAQLYARTALSAKELGTSQEELLRVTETVNQAIILSGASAKEANNGLIQLSQAISSNRLAGDELRSVLEQLPVVADIIARELGVTRGQLRELGKDGEISGAVIVRAFANARGEIQDKFAKTVPTAAQSLEILRNNLISFLGEVNKSTGATQLFASVIQLIAKNLDVLAGLAAAFTAAFAAGPIVRFAQGLRTAAINQEAFNAFKAASIPIAEASLAAAKAEDVALAQSSIQRTEAALAAARAQQSQSLAILETTEATIAQTAATRASALMDVRKAQASLAVAQAEAARLAAQPFSRFSEQAAVEAQLLALETARARATTQLAAAEATLASATRAATLAQEGRVVAAAQLAALEKQLAAQTLGLAAAQRNLNVGLAATPTLLSKIQAFVVANPFGVAVAAIGALLALLVDVRGITDSVSSALSAVGETIGIIRKAVSGLAVSFGASESAFQGVVRLAIAGTAAIIAFKVAAASAGAALALGLGAALLVLGELARRLDAVNEDLKNTGNALAANDIISRLVRTRQEVERLQAVAARDPGNQLAAQKLVEAQEKLARLERERNRGLNERRDVNPLQRELAEQQELIRLFGVSAREREIELGLIKQRAQLLKEGVTVEVGSDADKALRDSALRLRAAEELFNVVEEAKGPFDELARRGVLLRQALDGGRISADQFSGAMNKLFADSRAANPLGDAVVTLGRDLGLLRALAAKPVVPEGGDELSALQAARREAETRFEIEQAFQQLRDRGVSEQELAGSRGGDLERLIRERAETERLVPLQEQLAQLRRQRADESATALLPEFEQGVQRQIQALRELNDVIADPAAEAAAVRRNALAQEFGGILNSLSSPALAQAQAQQEVNAQIERANEAYAAGILNGQQYALVLQDLDFKARAASTAFADGFTVALDQMVASINDATVGNQLLTSAVNAATSATSEFVQQGSVDWRKLALNIIDSIAQIITQLLVLKAIKAIAGIGSIGGDGSSVGEFGPVPGRAAGGPVQANRPFIVGEEGPELFVPGRSGTVIPNDQVVESMARAGNGSSAPVVVPAPAVNVSITNVTDPNDVLDAIDSPAGERRIVNAINRNPQAIRRGLGT